MRPKLFVELDCFTHDLKPIRIDAELHPYCIIAACLEMLCNFIDFYFGPAGYHESETGDDPALRLVLLGFVEVRWGDAHCSRHCCLKVRSTAQLLFESPY